MTETEANNVVGDIFQKIARGIIKHPDTALKVGAVYLFRIKGENGGVFHVDLKDNPGVSLEEKPAECILEINDRDFIKLYKGILPGFKAVMSGKLKIKGELTLATRLNEIFSQSRLEE